MNPNPLETGASTSSAKELRMTRADADGHEEKPRITATSGGSLLSCSVPDVSREQRRVLERAFFHDLLNSIAGLNLSVDTIQGSSPTPVIAASARLILSCSEHLVSAIRSYESLLAAENGELKTRYSWFSTLDMLTLFSEEFQQQFLHRGCTLSIATETVDIRVCSDQTLLGRVLADMLKNALESSTPGSSLTLGSRSVDNDFEIWVHDPQFMPQETLDQTFQRSLSTNGAVRILAFHSMSVLSERYLHGHVRFCSDKVTGTSFIGRYPVEFGQ